MAKKKSASQAKRQAALNTTSKITAKRAQVEDTLSSLFGLEHGNASHHPRYSSAARIIEVTQELTVTGKRGTADMYAQCVALSANPFSPLMAVYRNAAGSTEYFDFGQMDENGVDLANVAFSNLCDDNGLGTVFEKIGSDTAGKFRVFYPRMKSLNCIGGHAEVVGYGTITNTEGYIRTFEAENRGLWCMGGTNNLIAMSRDANAIRVPGYQTISAYSLNEQGDGGMNFPVLPAASNEEQHNVKCAFTPLSLGHDWNPTTQTLYSQDAMAQALALNPMGDNVPGGLIFDSGENYSQVNYTGYQTPTGGVCDPDFDIRFFDVSALSDSTKLRFTAKLYFICEPYVSQMGSFPAPSRGIRQNQKERAIAQAVASQAKKHGGRKSHFWPSFIHGVADGATRMLLGADGHFDLGDAARLGQGALMLTLGAATENPLMIASGGTTLSRPLLTM